MASWYLVDRMGRRNLSLYGLLGLNVILWLMGGLGVEGSPGAVKGTVAMIMLYCFWYNVTIGATAYTVLAEVATSRLRVKTVAIGLTLQYGLNMMWSFVLPYLFNPDKADLGAKLAFVFGGLAVLSLAFSWVYLPETAGRTYEELDEMFIERVPARKFKGYEPESRANREAVKAAYAKEVGA